MQEARRNGARRSANRDFMGEDKLRCEEKKGEGERIDGKNKQIEANCRKDKMKTHVFIGRIENKRAHIGSCSDVGTIK